MIAQAGYEMFKSGQVTEWEDTFVTQRQVSECVRNLSERVSLLLVDMPLFIGFEQTKCSSRGEIDDVEAYLTPAFRHLFTKWKITNKFTQTTMFLIVFMFFFINIAHFPNNTL